MKYVCKKKVINIEQLKTFFVFPLYKSIRRSPAIGEKQLEMSPLEYRKSLQPKWKFQSHSPAFLRYSALAFWKLQKLSAKESTAFWYWLWACRRSLIEQVPTW